MANGSIDSYENATSAVITAGAWDMRVTMDATVLFHATFEEENIDEAIEQSPSGTIDSFDITLKDYQDINIAGDSCLIIQPTLKVRKVWNLLTGGQKLIIMYLHPEIIWIDATELEIDVGPGMEGQNYDIWGTTKEIDTTTNLYAVSDPMQYLTSTRIWGLAYDPPQNMDINDGEVTYISHGWNSEPDENVPIDPWYDMTPSEQAQFLTTASFTLTIDNTPIPLRRVEWFDQEYEIMTVLFFQIFDLGTFTLGNTYKFAGYWYLAYGADEYDRKAKIRVTIVPSP